jgi:hypothetical protein
VPFRRQPDGAFEPVPQFSNLRNRALCEVFFGMSGSERAGTAQAHYIDSRQESFWLKLR